jgi:hypothetical protein
MAVRYSDVPPGRNPMGCGPGDKSPYLVSVVFAAPIEHSAFFDLTSLQKIRGRARMNRRTFCSSIYATENIYEKVLPCSRCGTRRGISGGQQIGGGFSLSFPCPGPSPGPGSVLLWPRPRILFWFLLRAGILCPWVLLGAFWICVLPASLLAAPVLEKSSVVLELILQLLNSSINRSVVPPDQPDRWR